MPYKVNAMQLMTQLNECKSCTNKAWLSGAAVTECNAEDGARMLGPIRLNDGARSEARTENPTE
jgi:hypothetical protein